MVNKAAIKDFTKFSLLTLAFTGLMSSAVLADSEFNHSRLSHVVVQHAGSKVATGVDSRAICSAAKFESN
jgi:hypothetical protein